MEIEGFELSSPFYDDKNFPWGFSRCGNFTIVQADILRKYGKTLKALDSKERAPSTTEEKQFVAVCRDKQAASTPVELAWMKYRALTGQKEAISVFGCSSIKSEDETVDYVDDDLDDEE